MSRPLALFFAFFLIAAADSGPLPHASGRPDGPGPGCGGAYTAARGDTLYSIARRCETSVAELVQENRLGSRPVLEPGQRLAIPGFEPAAPPLPPARDGRWTRVRQRVPVTAPLPPPPSLAAPRIPAPPGPHRVRPTPPPPPRADGDIYHFQSGDTLYSLARWARTSLAALRAANPDVDPRDVEIGDPIRLPRGAARPEPMRLRERGRPAPVDTNPPAPPPPVARPPRPPVAAPPRPRPPAAGPTSQDDEDEADKPKPDGEDGDGEDATPGGMDDGGPEPDGM